MAESQDIHSIARTADADLSGKQYHIVRLTAGKGTNLASLATTSAIGGVLQTVSSSGDRAAVGYSGVSKVVAGAALTENDVFTCNGSGRAVVVTSGQMAVGRALGAAGADGEVVTALIFPPFRWSGAA